MGSQIEPGPRGFDYLLLNLNNGSGFSSIPDYGSRLVPIGGDHVPVLWRQSWRLVPVLMFNIKFELLMFDQSAQRRKRSSRMRLSVVNDPEERFADAEEDMQEKMSLHEAMESEIIETISERDISNYSDLEEEKNGEAHKKKDIKKTLETITEGFALTFKDLKSNDALSHPDLDGVSAEIVKKVIKSGRRSAKKTTRIVPTIPCTDMVTLKGNKKRTFQDTGLPLQDKSHTKRR